MSEKDKVQDKKERIEYLVKEISRHRYLYYNAQPEISDAKYDAIEDELRELDPNNPILFKIGVDSFELFTKREHIIPMSSQDKVTNSAEFNKWARKRNYKTFLIQFKLDGISIELQYENGVFKYAITRGDGKIGDDVSVNVVKMKGFIPKLKTSFSGAVRAEILLFHDVYDKKYNQMENCRNAVTGIVRRKSGIGSGDLNLVYYDAISLDEQVQFESEIKKVKWLQEQGFPSIKTKTVHSAQEVIDTRKYVMDSLRDTLEYDIDGLVIKGNTIDLEDMKRARPMTQIAFKFQAEEIETTVLDVEWSLKGHNYTPVAIVETVKIMGANVSRANLSNPNIMKELGLKIGSEVMISRRGDSVPKIERLIKTSPDAIDIEIPDTCEVCKTHLTNEGTRLYCPNDVCPKRLYHRLLKWIDKLNVKHFSEKVMLSKLFETGRVQKIVDLYNLKISDLAKFDGVGETSAKKALNNLFRVKQIPLATFIAGFDIENIGEELVQKVVDAGFNTLEDIKNASVYQLSKIYGFAETTAQYLVDGVNSLYPDMLDVLNTNKIKIKGKKMGKLEGLSFCFTGKLDTFKNRTDAELLVAEHGGVAKRNVVKDLSYLVTNSTKQTEKYVKAQQQGTKIITEQEFLDMINK